MEGCLTIGGVHVFMECHQAVALVRELKKSIGLAAMFYPETSELIGVLQELTEG